MVGLLPSQLNTIIHGDALARLQELPDACIQCCVTSPPYFGLRDYGIDGQIGLEETPDDYIQKLVEVFREVRRVLKDDGTLWVNIGDSYAAGKAGRTDYGTADPTSTLGPHRNGLPNNSRPGPVICRSAPAGYKPKDLIGIPWMLAFALRADGWYLRMDCIWHKPNCMPESVKDRPTKSHEYLFLLSKSERYFYDSEAIKEEAISGYDLGLLRGRTFADGKHVAWHADSIRKRQEAGVDSYTAGSGYRNKRSVWTIPTRPFPDAHFATFPESLVEPCILAGTSPQACEHCGAPWERVTEREAALKPKQSGKPWLETPSQRPDGYKPLGLLSETQNINHTIGWQPTCTCPNNTGSGTCLVLDPFSGAGTVCLVAAKHGRSYLGIELNAEYIQLAKTRINKALGMWQCEEVAV